jgi:lipopolysaccharide export LptBFGC system permease protein LptF
MTHYTTLLAVPFVALGVGLLLLKLGHGGAGIATAAVLTLGVHILFELTVSSAGDKSDLVLGVGVVLVAAFFLSVVKAKGLIPRRDRRKPRWRQQPSLRGPA